jgi:hypothetical protein
VLFLIPSVRNNMKLLPIACAMAFAGIWIEKGMGLIVPGFIPSPIGEVTEYYPTFVEWLMTLGIWAFGFFILTILLKGAIGILLGDIKFVPGHAVIKPRTDKLVQMPACGVACHNGIGPAFVPPTLPKGKKPHPIPTMEAMVPDLQNLQHGRGKIWCMDCHHATKRNKLVDNFGDPVSFDEPQWLCGKCHGDKFRDWSDGIHGKRIGEWASTGKKRWFTCTECHNPHNVQDGQRNRGFVQLEPEAPPQLPKGMKDARWEKTHAVHH